MLSSISPLLTGDILKALCDMGHGDTLVISDSNFPGNSINDNLIYCPGTNVTDILEAIKDLFPLDTAYTEFPAQVMQVTEGDRAKGMKDPTTWDDFENTLNKKYPDLKLGKVDRFDFYDKAKEAYVVIQTNENRLYGNILLTKGVVVD